MGGREKGKKEGREEGRKGKGRETTYGFPSGPSTTPFASFGGVFCSAAVGVGAVCSAAGVAVDVGAIFAMMQRNAMQRSATRRVCRAESRAWTWTWTYVGWTTASFCFEI